MSFEIFSTVIMISKPTYIYTDGENSLLFSYFADLAQMSLSYYKTGHTYH